MEHIDQQLLLLLNGSDSVFFDGFWMTLTNVTTWLLLYFVLFVVLMRSNNMRQLLLTLALVALTILLADQFSSGFCKPFFHRLRPSHEPALSGLVDIVDGYEGGLYGFISSHAANSFALATFISLILRYRWTTFSMFTYAALTSYSRIYLGVHYPGDILCGALWGVFCGFLFYLIYRYFYARIPDNRQYFSDTYTSTGVLKDDAELIPFSLSLTILYVIFRALFYALSH